MKPDYRLLFGPLAAVVLACGIAGLAPMVADYDHIRQTVSEIGEAGSPARVPFALMLGVVALCLLIFASALRNASLAEGRAPLAAWLTGFMALPVMGVGVFAHPHPLHNVFGLSEMIGYLSPLAFALTWRRVPRAGALVAFAWLMFGLVWIAIALNLSALDSEGFVWAHVEPRYGLAQRALFATWFGWCAVTGLVLFLRGRRSAAAVSA